MAFVGSENIFPTRDISRKILTCLARVRRISTARYGGACLETEKKVTMGKKKEKGGKQWTHRWRKDEIKGGRTGGGG